MKSSSLSPALAARGPSRATLRLMALLSAATMALTAAAPVTAADAPPSSEAAKVDLLLPVKPSELLRAPASTWEPLLKQVAAALDERVKQSDSLSKSAQTELNIQRTVLAQERKDWPVVLESVKRTRQLQDGETGRQTAGLLNALLAQQAAAGGDAAWLQRHLRDQVLAMPWADVEPAIRMLREQLAGMTGEAVENYVVNRMDRPASMVGNNASLSFVMQLLALRFQLLEVMPRRDALLGGLDEAIAKRSGAK